MRFIIQKLIYNVNVSSTVCFRVYIREGRTHIITIPTVFDEILIGIKELNIINPLSPSVPNLAHKITPVSAELHKNCAWFHS